MKIRRWALRLLVISVLLLAVAVGAVVVPASRPVVVRLVSSIIMSSNTLSEIEPFQIFDNVFYVGTRAVSAYVIESSDGLVLIDALYGTFADYTVEGVQTLGLDPADLRYVFITHGHWDHVAAAGRLQSRYGASIVMTEPDWQPTREQAGSRGFVAPQRDVMVHDGDTLAVGDVTFRFWVTPGHTPGVLSIEFAARDGDMRYRAFVFGGATAPLGSIEAARAYLESVRRVKVFAQATVPIEVNLPNHPGWGEILERRSALGTRGAGDPHPYVDSSAFLSWLDDLELEGKDRLEVERGLR